VRNTKRNLAMAADARIKCS